MIERLLAPIDYTIDALQRHHRELASLTGRLLETSRAFHQELSRRRLTLRGAINRSRNDRFSRRNARNDRIGR